MMLSLVILPLIFLQVQCKPKFDRGKSGSSPHGYYGGYNMCKLQLWPWPSEVQCDPTGSALSLDPELFQVLFSENSKSTTSEILTSAITRYKSLAFNQPIRLTRGYLVEPGLVFESDDDGNSVAFKGMSKVNVIMNVQEDHDGEPKQLNSDESYEIIIDTSTSIQINSQTIWGAMYGLETLSQLIEPNNIIRHTPIHIQDIPRYPWRGFLLDTTNHFLSKNVILKLIDGLASMKLNVLHWHLVDSYSFPYQSDELPELSLYGQWITPHNSKHSPNLQPNQTIYSLSDVNEIIEYATMRGLRVVPEIDMPGHAYSWGLSPKYHNITARCPRYTDELGHVDDIPLDPTLELTYETIQLLLTELQSLFHDVYLHVGGDEVKYGCWNESASIVEWMQVHDIEKDDFYTLEQYFFSEIGDFVTGSLGKNVVAWEEVFFNASGGNDGSHGSWLGSNALPPSSTVVEVWTGPSYLQTVRANGYDGILAYGWYLDRQNPVDGEADWFYGDSWAQMYQVDPEPFPMPASNIVKTEGGEREVMVGRALGGEASMWTEQVDDWNIESQVFPRVGAPAERLWSPKYINDAGAAAPRLSAMRCRLAGRYGIRAGPIWSDYCSALP